MTANHYRSSYKCRLCDSSKIVPVLKLASTPPANAFVTKDKCKIKQEKYPLRLFFANHATTFN